MRFQPSVQASCSRSPRSRRTRRAHRAAADDATVPVERNDTVRNIAKRNAVDIGIGEKVRFVVPRVTGNQVWGTPAWDQFADLRRLRDEVTHLRDRGVSNDPDCLRSGRIFRGDGANAPARSRRRHRSGRTRLDLGRPASSTRVSLMRAIGIAARGDRWIRQNGGVLDADRLDHAITTPDTATLRKARGAFFTPPELCDTSPIGRFVGRDDVLEPSCGEAAFLMAAAERQRSLARGASPAGAFSEGSSCTRLAPATLSRSSRYGGHEVHIAVARLLRDGPDGSLRRRDRKSALRAVSGLRWDRARPQSRGGVAGGSVADQVGVLLGCVHRAFGAVP